MKNLFRVIKQTEPIQVASLKAEGGTISKSTLVLQELGGKYENSYVVTLLGNAAMGKYLSGDLVFAALRFTTHEHNGASSAVNWKSPKASSVPSKGRDTHPKASNLGFIAHRP